MRHGTGSAYRAYGCRCDVCVEAQRARWRQRRRLERAKERLLPWRQWTKSRCAHVDEVAVQRAKHGDRVQLSVIERRIVVTDLTGQGLSAREIACRLGISVRSVQRYRGGRHVMVGRAA